MNRDMKTFAEKSKYYTAKYIKELMEEGDNHLIISVASIMLATFAIWYEEEHELTRMDTIKRTMSSIIASMQFVDEIDKSGDPDPISIWRA